jgi:hypothetical protein
MDTGKVGKDGVPDESSILVYQGSSWVRYISIFRRQEFVTMGSKSEKLLQRGPTASGGRHPEGCTNSRLALRGTSQ